MITADWWMRGKCGAQKGALDAHWVVYNQVTTMMGGATEFDVVCAPDPNNAQQMNPSAYNSCVRHAWEIGWCDKPPGQDGGPVTDEIKQQLADWYARFVAAHTKK